MQKLVESHKIVTGGGPVLLNTAGITGDIVSMKNYDHVTILVGLTPASGTDTAAITLQQHQDVAGTGAKTLAYTGAYKCAVSTTVDALAAIAVAGNSITTSAAAAQELYAIEVDGAELDVANGFDCISCDVSDPGAVSTPAFVLYILGRSRMQQATPPSAIVD